MKASLILEKVAFLRGVLDPNEVDGKPGQPGPTFRLAMADCVVAEIMRDISANLTDRQAALQLRDMQSHQASIRTL